MSTFRPHFARTIRPKRCCPFFFAVVEIYFELIAQILQYSFENIQFHCNWSSAFNESTSEGITVSGFLLTGRCRFDVHLAGYRAGKEQILPRTKQVSFQFQIASESMTISPFKSWTRWRKRERGEEGEVEYNREWTRFKERIDLGLNRRQPTWHWNEMQQQESSLTAVWRNLNRTHLFDPAT